MVISSKLYGSKLICRTYSTECGKQYLSRRNQDIINEYIPTMLTAWVTMNCYNHGNHYENDSIEKYRLSSSFRFMSLSCSPPLCFRCFWPRNMLSLTVCFVFLCTTTNYRQLAVCSTTTRNIVRGFCTAVLLPNTDISLRTSVSLIYYVDKGKIWN